MLIAKKPSARLEDKARCRGAVDEIATGEPTVLIGGKPAARQGDWTSHGGRIRAGEESVLIGRYPQEACFTEAATEGIPFIEMVP